MFTFICLRIIVAVVLPLFRSLTIYVVLTLQTPNFVPVLTLGIGVTLERAGAHPFTVWVIVVFAGYVLVFDFILEVHEGYLIKSGTVQNQSLTFYNIDMNVNFKMQTTHYREQLARNSQALYVSCRLRTITIRSITFDVIFPTVLESAHYLELANDLSQCKFK